MKPTHRRFLIAVTSAVVIAASAGIVIADSRSSGRFVVAETSVSDEKAEIASVSVQRFFYYYEGEFAVADHLQGL